jgi:hypothetical protein
MQYVNKQGVMQPVPREWIGKDIPMAMNMHTIEELVSK